MLYVFYILVVGISVTSEISGGRAFAALMIQLIIYSGTIFALIFGAVFLYSFSETPYSYPSPYGVPDYYETPYKPEPVSYDITVFAGSPPEIDGIVDVRDSWYEGESIHAEMDGKDYTITAKHDFENIYILIQLNGTEEWKDAIALHFEQDENGPDFDLKTGITDTYMHANDLNGTATFRDGHFKSIYTDIENQNSNLKSSYKDGMWSLEWQIPLRSGDVHDIYVDRYPTRIGFALIDWTYGARGIWPQLAHPNKPETWGNITIVRGRRGK